eukprot:6207700-Pleurochrysis_carterae.AAC.8
MHTPRCASCKCLSNAADSRSISALPALAALSQYTRPLEARCGRACGRGRAVQRQERLKEGSGAATAG